MDYSPERKKIQRRERGDRAEIAEIYKSPRRHKEHGEKINRRERGDMTVNPEIHATED